MKKVWFFVVLALTLNAKMIDGISAVVEDKIITLYEIKQAMQKTNADEKTALELLIRKKLEDIEIKKRGIEVSDEEFFNEIKKLASLNHMSISEFYDLAREKNGLKSSELKEKIREKLLHDKLYAQIAMSKMQAPSENELREYFNLHKEQFSRPSFVDAVIYESDSQELLVKKMQNPMFYSQKIKKHQQRIPLDKIPPQLAQLLLDTKENHFTQIIPKSSTTYIMFFITKKAKPADINFEDVKNQVLNAVMMEKRVNILDDYFAKLKDSAKIKVIRLPN